MSDNARPRLARLGGYLLLTAAPLGILVSLVGLYAVWRSLGPFNRTLSQDLALINAALAATGEALAVLDRSLETAVENTTALEATLTAAATSTQDTAPLFATLATLIGEDLPRTIDATVVSLDSAQDSARIIEDVLLAVTGIPFYPGERYAPDVPLHLALGEVAGNLEDLPPALEAVEEDLQETRGNLASFELELREMARTVGRANGDLSDAQRVVDRYQTVFEDVSARLTALQNRLPGLTRSLAWGVSAFLIWLGLTQVGLVVQGLLLLRD